MIGIHWQTFLILNFLLSISLARSENFFMNLRVWWWFVSICWYQVISFQIENGADLFARDVKNCTPFLYAAAEGNVQTIRFLIDAGTFAVFTSTGNSASDFPIGFRLPYLSKTNTFVFYEFIRLPILKILQSANYFKSSRAEEKINCHACFNQLFSYYFIQGMKSLSDDWKKW